MQQNANLEFRKIPSLDFLYEVNENGTVFRNVKSKKQLKIKLDFHHSKDGYYATFVHLGGRGPNERTVRVMIQRVVAECWLGPCPAGYEVDHRDGNAHNNDYRNLRYVTKSEQMKNRDHTRISTKGSMNLDAARRERAKPVMLRSSAETVAFTSYAECARWLSEKNPNASFESVRQKLKAGRSHIFGYDVKYLSECRDCTR